MSEHLCQHLRFMDRQQQREQEQGSSESLEIQVFFNYLAILGVLLAVKYQGGVSVSLFEEHKKIIYIFVIVISIYVATIIVGKKLGTKGTKAIEPIRLLSATIAPILLFFILVPELGWPALGLWVILAAKMGWDYLPQLYHSLGSWVIIAAKKAWDCVRPSPSDTDQQPCEDLSQNIPSDTDQHSISISIPLTDGQSRKEQHFMDRQREQEQGLNSSIEQDQGSSESIEIQA